MKTLIIISTLIICTPTSAGQKVRLIDDSSTFLCIGDSLSHNFISNLKQQRVDSIISILYDYDNGRVEKAQHLIMWTKEGKSQVRKIRGCDDITSDTTYAVQLKPILVFISKTRFKGLSEPIKSDINVSHSMGYFTLVELGKRTFEVNVRDYHLQKTVGNKEAQNDARVKLIEMLAKL